MKKKRCMISDVCRDMIIMLFVLGCMAGIFSGCNSSSDSNDAPTAVIDTPSHESNAVEGDEITFTGKGSDNEDGDLTGSALIWTSDKDGSIGTGTSFVRSDLSSGDHLITLTATDSEGAAQTASVNITVSVVLKTVRDDRGVWFITGPDDASLYDISEATGYAVATDRLWQAEKYRRTGRGRLAEIFGPDQLNTDIFVRSAGYSDQELEDAFDSLDSESQDIINGYVAGFNRRIVDIRADASLLPFEFKAIGARQGIEFVPEDWTAKDVLAWMATMLRFFDSEAVTMGQIDNAALYQGLLAAFPDDYQAMFQDLRWISDPDATTYIPKSGDSRRANRPEPGTENPKPAFSASAFHFPPVAAKMAAFQGGFVESLKKINAYVKIGSYAWVVSGEKTESGNPILYSGPQMDHGFQFAAPSLVLEGSIRAGGLNVSGMGIAGIPGIIVGRTPHHAWSMQVGHAHTVDYYVEDPSAVTLHRVETIKVAGGADVQLPVYRTSHGPVVNPMPYNPETYVPDPANPIMTWKYAHWGYELQNGVKSILMLARASDMDAFGEGIELVPVSQHFCYADRDGNIAYWMSGRDPVRPSGTDPRFPLMGDGTEEWPEPVTLIPRSTDRNTSKGFYGGWNSRSSHDYNNAANAIGYTFGPFHRAHVVEEYLSSPNPLTFEDVRDLALHIATTDSLTQIHEDTFATTYGDGGNPWTFVEKDFSGAVQENSTEARNAALALFENWDGHFVEGGKADWAAGTTRSDAWILMNAWIREVIRLTFTDELGPDINIGLLFNVLLHGLSGTDSSIVNNYGWFQNLADADAPQTRDAIILNALDNVLGELGERPWGTDARGRMEYTHEMIGPVHSLPASSRSTYAHCVEMASSGPVRIESMFPLGESGTILMDAEGNPLFDEHFLSMTEVYDFFAHRAFPLFE